MTSTDLTPASILDMPTGRVSYGHRSGSAEVAVTIIGISAKSFRSVYLEGIGEFTPLADDPLGYAASVLIADQLTKLADLQDRRVAKEEAANSKDFAMAAGRALGVLDSIVELTTTALVNGEQHMAAPAREFIRGALQKAGEAIAKDREMGRRMAEQDA